MIKNDEELTIVREQIQRMVSALASLKRSTGPTGETQFYILSEGCVDMIAELQGQVEDYLNSTAAPAGDKVDGSTKAPVRQQGAA